LTRYTNLIHGALTHVVPWKRDDCVSVQGLEVLGGSAASAEQLNSALSNRRTAEMFYSMYKPILKH